MIIEAVRIRNFRCISDETLHCDELTALVGANGSGKSSFLRGIELFYNPSPKLDALDFHACVTSEEISITVTYRVTSAQAREQFATYTEGDRLTIERVFAYEGDRITWKYHGSRLQNAELAGVRSGLEVKDRGKTAKESYEALRAEKKYSALPNWTTVAAVEPNLRAWEEANPEYCIRQRDDGQFFGFKEVAQGYLGKFTQFLFIPAVRDAADDASEGKGAVLTALMDLVVRSALAKREALQQLKDETQKKYEEVMDPTKLTELSLLSSRLTDTLTTFAPNARVELQWQPLEAINFPMPKADIRLVEDDYGSPVGRTGHGLQRAFILTMLQHLAAALLPPAPAVEGTGQEAAGNLLPSLVLAIEEPELYQHPSRQRHLAHILAQLASGAIPGVAGRTQIIYGTHSPLFVGLDRIDRIRLLRKVSMGDGKPKRTKIIQTSLDEVAGIVWTVDEASGAKYTGASILPRLQAIMTPWMNEGFFADIVVLVEGEDDRAAILGVAKSMGYDLESMGVSVIPCGGKTNLDRPYIIFRSLGIPAYVVWDGDCGKGTRLCLKTR